MQLAVGVKSILLIRAAVCGINFQMTLNQLLQIKHLEID